MPRSAPGSRAQRAARPGGRLQEADGGAPGVRGAHGGGHAFGGDRHVGEAGQVGAAVVRDQPRQASGTGRRAASRIWAARLWTGSRYLTALVSTAGPFSPRNCASSNFTARSRRESLSKVIGILRVSPQRANSTVSAQRIQQEHPQSSWQSHPRSPCSWHLQSPPLRHSPAPRHPGEEAVDVPAAPAVPPPCIQALSSSRVA